jgi:P27 family predicted phage terminase small subunit
VIAVGVRGPKPQPVSLKLLHGRAEGRDSAGREIKPVPGFVRLPPEAPDFLPPEARAEWDRVVPELQRLEILKPIDRAALTAYCLIWQRLVDAQADIAAGKLTTKGSQGQLVQHPSVQVALAASKELRAWCSEFGLTPSSENRLAARKGDDSGQSNPFAGPAAATG